MNIKYVEIIIIAVKKIVCFFYAQIKFLFFLEKKKILPVFHDLPNLVSNASTFYWNSSVMRPKILFVLQLNGRNSRQIYRFLKLIYRPNHLYYIHVDIRQNYMFKGLIIL